MIYLFIIVPTGFTLSSWPSSGILWFLWCVQLMWKLIWWQFTYMI